MHGEVIILTAGDGALRHASVQVTDEHTRRSPSRLPRAAECGRPYTAQVFRFETRCPISKTRRDNRCSWGWRTFGRAADGRAATVDVVQGSAKLHPATEGGPQTARREGGRSVHSRRYGLPVVWTRTARTRAAEGMTPLGIVLVEPTLDDNGAIRVSLDRADRWRRSGAQVVVLVVEHGLPDQVAAVPEGLDVRQATKRPLRFRWTMLCAGWKLLRLARHADVVVAGREVHLGLVLADLLRPLFRRPLAVTVQSRPDVALLENVDDALRARTRRALVRSDLAVCVGSELVPVLVELGLPARRAKVVRNGIDVPGFRALADAPAELTLPSGPYVVGVGRLHRQKGFDLLLRAHARALELGAPEHALVLVGDGPQRAELHQLAEDLGIVDSVLFAGFVRNPHAVVARSQLFVLASRWEGLPLVLAEALCLGVPVIATRCVAGPQELLENGRFGGLVPVDDVHALAAAMTEHLRDPDPLRASARSAADTAVERFDPQTAADDHLALLRELAQSASPVRSGRHRTSE